VFWVFSWAIICTGLAQPDEDDYGYVSQEASALNDKLKEKYTSIPSEEPQFSKNSLKSSVADLNNTKVCLESIIMCMSLSVYSIFKV
jgi:protein SPT2